MILVNFKLILNLLYVVSIIADVETENANRLPSMPVTRLAFGVMIYQKKEYSPSETYELFSNIMNEIYDKNHLYVLHVDIINNKRLQNRILVEYCQQLNNCHIIAPCNVAWASLSTGEMMLAFVQEAFESGFHWDNFVFIGHESMSLTSISYLERLIASYPKGTMSTYTTV
jgi:hypothetical protein